MSKLNILKGFFKNNLNANSNAKENTDSFQEKAQIDFGKLDTQTYEEWGFDTSRKQRGNEKAFSGSWALVKEYYCKKEKSDIEKQEQNLKNAKTEVDKREIEKSQKNGIIQNIKEKIEHLKQKIDELKKDILRITEDPKSVQKDASSKVSLIIGIIILTGLTLYLFVFYSSAVYSAFFKEFTPDNNTIVQAILDGQAIPKSFELGLGAVLFVLGIPFAFLGLGYLIHKFQEGTGFAKYVKIGSIILVTFIFDVILAYEIVEKIYDIKRMGDITGRIPEFNLSIAFTNIQFWSIIFAGFIVYLIWGFVFDLTMEAYHKLDVVNRAIKAKESEIKLLDEDINKHQKEIEENQESIHKLELEIIPFQRIINGDTFVLNWSHFYQCINEFANGWTEWMTANKYEKQLVDEIHLLNQYLIKEHKQEIAGKNNDKLNLKQN